MGALSNILASSAQTEPTTEDEARFRYVLKNSLYFKVSK
jgi:hypothetical protein